MSVAEAAEALGVQGRQVRNLIAHAHLDAEHLGRAWMVSSASVDEYLRLNVATGRPLAAETSWWFLAAVSAALHEDRRPVEQPADRRDRYRLRKLEATSPAVEQWSAWLRRRSTGRHVWFHPGATERIRSDERVTRVDLSSDLGLAVGDLSTLYVAEVHFDAFVAAHHGRSSDGLGIADAKQVMVVPAISGSIDWHLHVAASTLVDLSSSPDSRVRHAALARLTEADAVLKFGGDQAGERS